MFDQNGKGFVTLSDLQSILYSALAMGPDEVEQLFIHIDTKNSNEITFDEFKSYISEKPEYAKIFLVYNEIKMLRNNIELDKLASSPDKLFEKPVESQERTETSSADASHLIKRAKSQTENDNEAGLVVDELDNTKGDNQNFKTE